MARIAGINIPPHKHAEIGLTAIYGVGRSTAQKICDASGVPYDRKVRDLSDADLERIREEIGSMARDNAGWLQRRNIFARTVTIKVRYDDFTTITRSDTKAPTNDPDEIARRAVDLLTKTDAGKRPVRLLGAGVHNLSSPEEQPADDPSKLPFEI